MRASGSWSWSWSWRRGGSEGGKREAGSKREEEEEEMGDEAPGRGEGHTRGGIWPSDHGGGGFETKIGSRVQRGRVVTKQ